MALKTNDLYDEAGTGAPDFPAGMPTVGGAPIVESGSNSDGSWTRWADGTQRGTASKNLTGDGTTTYAVQDQPYPATFVGEVYGSLSGYSTYHGSGVNGCQKNLLILDPADYTARVEYNQSTSSSFAIRMRFTFSGRWK